MLTLNFAEKHKTNKGHFSPVKGRLHSRLLWGELNFLRQRGETRISLKPRRDRAVQANRQLPSRPPSVKTCLLYTSFCGTNAETAYLLGKYCGLRINECYGLKWSDIDLEEGTIRIERQMQYQEGVIKLVSLKTRNAKRTMYMAPPLREYLKRLYLRKLECEKTFAAQRQQKQIFIEDTNGKAVSCLELVNTLENGKRQTINSMKYHAQEVRRRTGIQFKYHYLRHTYGTALAELNTPAHILCNQMGHGNIKVTQQYYIAVSKRGIDTLKNNLESL